MEESELGTRESEICSAELKPWTEQYLEKDLDTPSDESNPVLTSEG